MRKTYSQAFYPHVIIFRVEALFNFIYRHDWSLLFHCSLEHANNRLRAVSLFLSPLIADEKKARNGGAKTGGGKGQFSGGLFPLASFLLLCALDGITKERGLS